MTDPENDEEKDPVLKVYQFTRFPTKIGFIVAEGEGIHQCLTETLTDWAAEQVTTLSCERAHLESGDISLVVEYETTEEGWEKALEKAYELGEY